MQKLFSLFLSLALLSGCAKEEDFNNTDTKVGSNSRVVFFPTIATKGNRLVIINQGGSYTDAGATATLAGKPAEFATVGAVNTAVPGVYELSYEASNPEGYSVSDFRTVVVIGNDVANNDFSGTYVRSSNGISSTWTKIAPGVYEVDNPGGAGVGVGYKVIVVNYEGNKIKIPRQIAFDPSSGDKEATSANETFNATATPPSYSWVFLTGGYGTALRTFVKQ